MAYTCSLQPARRVVRAPRTLQCTIELSFVKSVHMLFTRALLAERTVDSLSRSGIVRAGPEVLLFSASHISVIKNVYVVIIERENSRLWSVAPRCTY